MLNVVQMTDLYPSIPVTINNISFVNGVRVCELNPTFHYIPDEGADMWSASYVDKVQVEDACLILRDDASFHPLYISFHFDFFLELIFANCLLEI